MNTVLKRTVSLIATLFLLASLPAASVAGTGLPTSDVVPGALPIVHEPITITFLCDNGANDVVKNYNEVKFIQEAEKLTGIHIEWIHPLGKNEEYLSLLLASHEYPDIMENNFAKNYIGGAAQAAVEGVIVPLDALIAEYGPNLTAYFEKYPDLLKDVRESDGQIYGYPMSLPDLGSGLNYMGPQINKTWLDALGLDPPETLDEWEVVLAAFKEAYPDKPPFLSLDAFAEENGYVQMIFFAHGVTPRFWQEDGVVKYGPLEPGFKDALERLHKWYANGWLDNECVTDNWITYTAKRDMGDFGANYYWCNLTKKNGDEFIGLPMPTLEGGDRTINSNSETTIQDIIYAISTTNPYQAESIAYLDFFYGGQGMMLANWGVEYESYVVKDGVPRFTSIILNPPSDRPRDAALNLYTALTHAFPKQHIAAATYAFRTPAEGEALDMWNEHKDVYKIPTARYMSADDADAYSRIDADMRKYVSMMMTGFMMGTESFDKWDTFQSTLKRLGVDEYLALQQKNADIYFAR